jgi:hypothetical protein
MKEAVLLRADVYTAVSEAPIPSRRGFGILLIMLFVVSLAQVAGALFDVATLPRVELVQDALYEAITGLAIFQNAAAANPAFANGFSTVYNIFWLFLRWFGGYPSLGGTLILALASFISGIFAWLTYGFIGFYVARAFGAKIEKMGDFLGLMGLAFAPLILNAADMIPGLVVPDALILLWFLAAVYQAVHSTYQLSWWRAALIVVLPFPINSILLTLTIQLGVFIGVTVSKMILS